MEYISEIINGLFVTYKDNPYMLQRLNTHLTNLPSMLEQENKKYDERVSRINELLLEQDNFYKVFLSKHQYYYMPYNNIYYEYDGKTYRIVKDDDIHHNLLSTITDEGKLVPWKHKTKQNIIKQIKERSLFRSIPDAYTIHSIAYITTGNSIMGNFISKFHDSHKLSLYRLIKTNETTSIDIIKDTLNNIGIDLLCVAAHYSDRYTNSDNYLKSKTDISMQDYVLYFVDNPMEKIVDDFVSQCIEVVNTGSNITWKNMHYIWKLYLSNINVPNMIYSSNLLTMLSSKLQNINDDGSIIFTNVTSKYLPNVSSFLTFWDKHVSISNENNVDDEYEIDELATLYKNSDLKNSQLSDTYMIKMICHYFAPHVEIIDNKFITNIKCNLWSKQDDINEYLQTYKTVKTSIEVNPDLLVSFDELYSGYKVFIKSKGIIEHKSLPIVSKHFFEKFLSNQLQLYNKFDKFVSSEWLQQ